MQHLFVATAAALLIVTSAVADPLTGADAFGDWRSDRPGVERRIDANALPAPGETPVVGNSSRVVPRPSGGRPRVPDGFEVNLVASGLRAPRIMKTAPNGDIFIAESRGGRIRVLPSGGGDGSTPPETFASGLNRPYGIAFYPPGPEPRYVYVAETNRIVRFPYAAGDRRASAEAQQVVRVPAGGGHWTRDIAFSKDGTRMFIAVGSRSNVGEGMGAAPEGGVKAWDDAYGPGAAWGDETGRAAVLVTDPEGNDLRHFANGIRNCSGLAVEPSSGAVWCATNERDGLGDDLPPDFVTSVVEGGFYGWPWYYAGNHADPRRRGQRPDLEERAIVPDVLIQPHSAPLGIAFYEGDAFPADYSGDAFVALRGSWNRAKRTGYKVVRIPMEAGKATGAYEDFMTGFVLSDQAVWGRPTGIAVGQDGSLYVSEDGNGTIWRVTRD